MAWFDIDGLEELAERASRTAVDLEGLRAEGGLALAQVGLTTDQARYQSILLDRERWSARLATDLRARADGVSEAEALLTSRVTFNPHDRLTFGSAHPGGSAISVPVADALARIEDLLRTDGTKIGWVSFGDTEVTASELEEVARIMLELEPPDLRELVRTMDDDLLRAWLDEADESNVDPRLEAELFEYVGTVGGTQLPRMVLLSDGATQDRLLSAIDDYSAQWVKSWLFRLVAGTLGDLDEGPRLAVETFAMLDDDYRGRALTSLEILGRLDGFVAGMVTEEVDHRTSGGFFGVGGHLTVTHRYDASDLAALVDLLPRHGYADAKAALFVASVELLEARLADASDILDAGFSHSTVHRFDDESGTAALHALAVMLADDGPAIYDALRLEYDRFGDTTSAFMRELFREPGARATIHGEPLSHDGALLANDILAALMDGGLDPASRAEFFTRLEPAVGGTLDHVNASRLGYFMGTVSSGLDDLGASEEDDWTAVGIVLGVSGLVDPTKVTSALKVGQTAFTAITDEITEQNVEQLMLEYRELEHLMVEAIVPQVGGRMYDGDAMDEFIRTYDVIGGGVVG